MVDVSVPLGTAPMIVSTFFPFLKQHDRGNATDSVLGRSPGALVCVQLAPTLAILPPNCVADSRSRGLEIHAPGPAPGAQESTTTGTALSSTRVLKVSSAIAHCSHKSQVTGAQVRLVSHKTQVTGTPGGPRSRLPRAQAAAEHQGLKGVERHRAPLQSQVTSHTSQEYQWGWLVTSHQRHRSTSGAGKSQVTGAPGARRNFGYHGHPPLPGSPSLRYHSRLPTAVAVWHFEGKSGVSDEAELFLASQTTEVAQRCRSAPVPVVTGVVCSHLTGFSSSFFW